MEIRGAASLVYSVEKIIKRLCCKQNKSKGLTPEVSLTFTYTLTHINVHTQRERFLSLKIKWDQR